METTVPIVQHHILIQNMSENEIYNQVLDWVHQQDIVIEKQVVNKEIVGIHVKGYISGYRNDYYTSLSEKRFNISLTPKIEGVNLDIQITPVKEMKIIRDVSGTKILWSDYIVNLYKYLGVECDSIILRELFPKQFLLSYFGKVRTELRYRLLVAFFSMILVFLIDYWRYNDALYIYWMMIAGLHLVVFLFTLDKYQEYDKIRKKYKQIYNGI